MTNHSSLAALLDFEDNWLTNLGGLCSGQRIIFQGQDLLVDLADKRWLELLLLGITGREFSKKQVRLFEGIWTLCASYPDPRIWINRVAALAGTTRSTGVIGAGAATAVFEAKIYGAGPILGAMYFLQQTKKQISQGQDLTTLIQRKLKNDRVIPGYGRPVLNDDERLTPTMALAKELALANGDFLKLALAIAETLMELQGVWALKMNAGALICALAADQGLSPQEFYHLMCFSSSIGLYSCFVDAHEKPEGAFFPLRCTRIKYEGKKPRKW